MRKKCEKCGNFFDAKDSTFRFCRNCFTQSRKDRHAKPEQVGLPDGYTTKEFFNNQGYILDNFITTWAEDIASKLGQSRPEMTKHQLRRFYNHLKTLERKLDVTGNYLSINEGIQILQAHVTNAAYSNPPKVPRLFEDFIKINVRKVNDSKSFYGFLKHFQAIVGFSEKYLKKN